MDKKTLGIIALVIVIGVMVVTWAYSASNSVPIESALVMSRYNLEDEVHSSGQSYYQFSGILGDKLVFSWGYYGKGRNLFVGFSGIGSEFVLGGKLFIVVDYDLDLCNWVELASCK